MLLIFKKYLKYLSFIFNPKNLPTLGLLGPLPFKQQSYSNSITTNPSKSAAQNLCDDIPLRSTSNHSKQQNVQQQHVQQQPVQQQNVKISQQLQLQNDQQPIQPQEQG